MAGRFRPPGLHVTGHAGAFRKGLVNMAKKQEKRRPASYFIDYENVRGAGLDGVEMLQKGDEVVVLYGSKDSALKLGAVQNVLDSPAKVRFVKVATGKHDALDFQLVALMFMKMKKKRDYYIVSRDTGFDFAIRMAKERGFEHVYRQETVSGATLEQKKLPSPKRSTRAKRLPQPKDAVPAAEAAVADAQPDEGAEAREQQPAKRPRRRGSRRGKRQDATQVPEQAQVLEQAPEQVKPQEPSPEGPARQAEASVKEGLPQQAQPTAEAVPPEPAPEYPVAPEAGEGPSAAAAEPVPTETPAEAAPAKKPRRRTRRAKQVAAPADPYRAQVEDVLAKHMGNLPEARKVDVVLAALDACDTKARFYNYLRGNLGNEQGVAFYREVKGCFEQLKAIER